MKKLLSIITVSLIFSAITGYADDKFIDFSALPQTAQQFASANFKDKKVAVVKQDRSFLGAITDGYDIVYSDGTEIEFDASGNWTSIDCEFANLPAGVLPETIITYIENNYPGSKAYKADKEFGGYEVGITGGLELIFNTAGEFVRESR